MIELLTNMCEALGWTPRATREQRWGEEGRGGERRGRKGRGGEGEDWEERRERGEEGRGGERRGGKWIGGERTGRKYALFTYISMDLAPVHVYKYHGPED